MANSNIPEEIVTNILKRLPVKSLMRFQCVSPAWLALIKSPFFRNMHIKHQKLIKNGSSSRSKEEKEEEYIMVLGSPRTENGNGEFMFYTRGEAGDLVPKPAPSSFPVFPHSKMELCAPCNGIFCVVAKMEHEPSIYLCNPATRESRKIPDRPFGFQPEKFPDSGVSYVLTAAWGLGSDPRTDECKFVSVMFYGTPGDRYYFDSSENCDLVDTMVAMFPFGIINHGIIQFEIFDLGSNTWREVDVELPPNILGLKKRKRNQNYVYTLDEWRGGGMFLNGCIHWLYNAYFFGHSILCFDISNETMRAFEVPFAPQKGDTLMVLGNSLAMVTAERRDFPIAIWVMEEYGNEDSWVTRYILDPYVCFLHPLISWKDDGDLLLFQAQDPEDTETLVSCNCSEQVYHTYHIGAVREPYLVLRAIVISEQTMVSVM